MPIPVKFWSLPTPLAFDSELSTSWRAMLEAPASPVIHVIGIVVEEYMGFKTLQVSRSKEAIPVIDFMERIPPDIVL